MPTSNHYNLEAFSLSNVYLRNGFRRKRNSADIQQAEDLHAAVISAIILKPYRLNAQEFRFVRELLRLTQHQFAETFDISAATVHLTENGASKIRVIMDITLRSLLRTAFSEIISPAAAGPNFFNDLGKARKVANSANGEYFCELTKGSWNVEFVVRRGRPRH